MIVMTTGPGSIVCPLCKQDGWCRNGKGIPRWPMHRTRIQAWHAKRRAALGDQQNTVAGEAVQSYS